MKINAAAAALALLLVSDPAVAFDPAAAASVRDTAPGFQRIGWYGSRSAQYSDNCKPYNGPYGYYGNPYCESGFNRYGKAGKYEIDLTRFFDERYYDNHRDRRRRR